MALGYQEAAGPVFNYARAYNWSLVAHAVIDAQNTRRMYDLDTVGLFGRLFETDSRLHLLLQLPGFEILNLPELADAYERMMLAFVAAGLSHFTFTILACSVYHLTEADEWHYIGCVLYFCGSWSAAVLLSSSALLSAWGRAMSANEINTPQRNPITRRLFATAFRLAALSTRISGIFTAYLNSVLCVFLFSDLYDRARRLYKNTPMVHAYGLPLTSFVMIHEKQTRRVLTFAARCAVMYSIGYYVRREARNRRRETGNEEIDRRQDIVEGASEPEQTSRVQRCDQATNEQGSFQEDISRPNHNSAISRYLGLVQSSPENTMLRQALSEAYYANGDYDEAMAEFWVLLRSNPWRLDILRKLRDACADKHQSAFPRMSLLRFAFCCFLSFLSEKLIIWDVGHSDWSPFAKEDDLMMVRPFMVKREWRSVRSLTYIPGHFHIDANGIYRSAQEEEGFIGFRMRLVTTIPPDELHPPR